MTTIQREDIPIRVLASGAPLTIPVFYVQGAADGPNVYVQANIHGPEIAGIGAAYDLLRRLRDEPTIHGQITIVPSINPTGLNSKINGYQVGYADLNETAVGNFNRIYQMLVTDADEHKTKVSLPAFAAAHKDTPLPQIKSAFRAALKGALDAIDAKRAAYGMSHGQKLASIIQHLSYDADYLIDLHTAGEAVYHMYTFPESLPMVRYFGLHYTILLDDSFSGVLDEAFLQPWLRLREAFANVGREIPFEMFALEAFTPELGSADTLDHDAMWTDAGRIMNYLRHKGVLEGEGQPEAGVYHFCKHDDYRRYRAPTGGLVLWQKGIGDVVQAGETIAVILRTYAMQADGGGQVEWPIKAVEDGIMINRTDTQVVHEGLGLCSVMANVDQLS